MRRFSLLVFGAAFALLLIANVAASGGNTGDGEDSAARRPSTSRSDAGVMPGQASEPGTARPSGRSTAGDIDSPVDIVEGGKVTEADLSRGDVRPAGAARSESGGSDGPGAGGGPDVVRTGCSTSPSGGTANAGTARDGSCYGNTPLVAAYPSRLRRGQNFFATWEGCGAGETVRFYLGYIFLGSATTNAEGKALAILQVPNRFQFGNATLTAICGPLFAQTQVQVVPNLILSKTTLKRDEFFSAEVFGCEPNQTMTFRLGGQVFRTTQAPSYGGPINVVLRVFKLQPPGPTTVSVTCGSKTWSENVNIVLLSESLSSSRDASGDGPQLPLALAAGAFAVVGIYLAPRKRRSRSASA